MADTDVVVHFAAESHNDNRLDNPWPFIESNIIGTYRLLEAVRRHGERLHHISTDEVYGDLELDDPAPVHRADPGQPLQPLLRDQGERRPAGARVGPLLRHLGHPVATAPTTTGRASTSRSSSPARSPASSQGTKPKLYGAGANVRDWIHVDDHNDAVIAILEQGRLGETYLIGADGEQNNRDDRRRCCWS